MGFNGIMSRQTCRVNSKLLVDCLGSPWIEAQQKTDDRSSLCDQCFMPLEVLAIQKTKTNDCASVNRIEIYVYHRSVHIFISCFAIIRGKKMCVLLIIRTLRSHYPSSDMNACSPSERESEFAIVAHFSFIHSRPMPGLIDRAWVCGRHHCPQCNVWRKALPAVWIRPVAPDLYKLLFLIVVKRDLSFRQKATVTDQLELV